MLTRQPATQEAASRSSVNRGNRGGRGRGSRGGRGGRGSRGGRGGRGGRDDGEGEGEGSNGQASEDPPVVLCPSRANLLRTRELSVKYHGLDENEKGELRKRTFAYNNAKKLEGMAGNDDTLKLKSSRHCYGIILNQVRFLQQNCDIETVVIFASQLFDNKARDLTYLGSGK